MTAGVVSAPFIIANSSPHMHGSRRDIDTDTPVFIQSGTNLGTLWKTGNISTSSFRSSLNCRVWQTGECVQGSDVFLLLQILLEC